MAHSSLLGVVGERSRRTRRSIRIAFANSAALVGFVAFFLTGNGLMYSLGLVFAVAGCSSFLPTAGRLERDQEQLIDHGCARSLVAALRTNRSSRPQPR